MQVVVALEFAQSGNVSKRLLYKMNPLGDRTDMIFYVRDAARQALLFFFFCDATLSHLLIFPPEPGACSTLLSL